MKPLKMEEMKRIEAKPESLPDPSWSPWQRHAWAAADYIERHGWCRFALSNAKGEVCVVSALVSVYDEMSPPLMTAKKIEEALGGIRLATWNDLIARDKEEVVSTLRRIAMTGRS
jgi:hypothetical protein